MNLIFGDKFRIDLKCDVDECTLWYEVLTAKKAFYSIKELLIDLKNEEISFVTKTFSMLMVIPIKEQNDWIVDHLKFDTAKKLFVHTKGEAFNILGTDASARLAVR